MSRKKISADALPEKFADYFVVCGLNEEEGLEPHQSSGDAASLLTPFQLSYKPSILWHFPENDTSNVFEPDGIKVLCMPRGVYFRKSQRRTATKFHSFLQTREDGTKIYGFVLTFFEKVDNGNIIVAMDTLFRMFDREVTLSTPSPTNPKKRTPERKRGDLNRTKSIYSFKKDNEVLYVSKCICVIMKKPFVSLAKRCLEDILHVGLNESQNSLHVESFIYNLLYEIPSPPAGRTMKFILMSGDPVIVQNPNANELPYFDYSMKEVLMTLGFDNIVDLFTCMLLEHQILLLSSDIHKLMLIAESLTVLFFPLLWQHVYVPVLPPFLLHYLDAPVPFIMGLYYDTEEEKDRLDIPFEGSLCLLDINNNTIHLPQEIPELPIRDELINELVTVAAKYNIVAPKGSLLLKNSLYQSIDSDISFEGSMESDFSFDSDKNSPDTCGTWPRKNMTHKSHLNMMTGMRRSSMTTNKHLHSNWAGKVNSPLHEHNSRKSISPCKNSPDVTRSVNPRLAAMVALAEKVGLSTTDILKNKIEQSPESLSSTAGVLVKDDRPVWGSRTLTGTRPQQHEDEINIVVREVFVNCFTQILLDYEHFVILPQQSKEDWINNRDQMQNFDKAAFLSDQSQVHLPFMTLFVETQGFASLIDMKIMALWEDCDPRLAYFDKRIDKMKVRRGIIRSNTYESCTSIPQAIETYVNRCNHIDHNAVQSHSLKQHITRESTPGCFPSPEKTSLMESSKRKSRNINWRKRDRIQQQKEHIMLNESMKVSQTGQKIKEKLAEKVKKYMQDSKTDVRDTNLSVQRTINVYAEKLLKECKMKTKRLVLLKLGQEAVELGHAGNTVEIEENTLIASLCDLLERVWCHGVHFRQLEFGKESAKSKFVQRMRQSKSALWSHLVAFYQRECDRMAAVYGITDTDSVPDEMKRLVIEATRQQPRKPSTVDVLSRAIRSKSPGLDESTSPHRDIERLLEENLPSSLPSTPTMPGLQSRQQEDLLTRIGFLNNLKTILEMKEIKTDTGYARAWTRLALEKKVLAKELRILLSQKKILATRYKNYAFIRTEDEMEQFLFHFLSLNAVDFYCFTNGFSNTVMTYKFHIINGRQISSTTTANCWVNLAGSYGNTDIVKVPKGELEFRFKHKNLGILTALRIGHDNNGISPGWFVEFVAVSNEITGQLYKFQCGRWLSKNEDDGSTERLLIATMINEKTFTEKRAPSMLCLGISDRPTPMTVSPSRGAALPSSTQMLTSSDIQEKMADAVNNIVKFFYKDSEDNMTFLMCGEEGFCQSMELVFRYRFKSSRLFGKNLFVWDYIKKVFDDYVYKDENNIAARMLQLRSSFCTSVQTINTAELAIGKEQKFQLFICLALRDHQLQNWLRLLAASPVTSQMYEPASFFRDESNLNFLIDVLESLQGFDIALDKSVTRGI